MGALEELAAQGGGEFPNLLAARELTERRLSGPRAQLADMPISHDACVVFFGPWGRREATEQSEFPWAVLVDGPKREGVAPTLEEVSAVVDPAAYEPAMQGVFGGTIFGDNLVERIGLESDDHTNLARRMLFLLESQAVTGEGPYWHCRSRLLDAYLADPGDSYRPPRTLLSELIRFWRTLRVDFVCTTRDERWERWALRTLELETSRKILFAGGLLPILLCHRQHVADMRDFLVQALEWPSTDRIARAALELDAAAGVRALEAYDQIHALLAKPDVRVELERLRLGEEEASAVFQQGRRLAAELEQGLLALLFETSLEPLVRENAIL